MLKQCLLVLVAAGIISIAAPAVVAQESPANDQGNSMGQGHHHGPDPAQRTQELTKRLKLNTDQQAKVKEALDSEHTQMESLRQDSSLSQDDRHAKMMDIHKGTDTQIRGVLDPDQQKKWDEMQAKRGQWMQGHHGPPPDAGSDQAPPQK